MVVPHLRPLARVVGPARGTGWVWVVGCVVVLAGCGVSTSPRQVVPEVYVEEATIAPEAEQTFGAEAVANAYREVTDFAVEVAFQEELLDPQRVDYTVAELTESVLPSLSDAADEGWSALVDRALAGDPEAQDGLRVLQFYRWDQPTWTVPPDGALRSQRITDAEISLAEPEPDGPPRLQVTFDHAARMTYVEDGGEFDVVVEKPMTYVLVLSPWESGPSWLIDAYDGSFRVVPGRR